LNCVTFFLVNYLAVICCFKNLSLWLTVCIIFTRNCLAVNCSWFIVFWWLLAVILFLGNSVDWFDYILCDEQLFLHYIIHLSREYCGELSCGILFCHIFVWSLAKMELMLDTQKSLQNSVYTLKIVIEWSCSTNKSKI
jgi:hypothetical protein